MICCISFSKFLDVLPVFTCTSAIGNLGRICLGVNILSPSPYFILYLALDTTLKHLIDLIIFSRDLQSVLLFFIALFDSCVLLFNLYLIKILF